MQRLTSWLWTGSGRGARIARLSLAPAAWTYGVAARAHTAVYRAGWLEARALPMPSVCIGNLTVGGTGKTPVSSWAAAFLQAAGVTPAILLRGYGRDEGLLHRRMVPSAVVVEDPDRIRGAKRAVAQGAHVAVLDDGYQRLSVRRDVDIVLVATESLVTPRRMLPAGPWRERWDALGRATVAVVTRKSARREDALAVAASMAAVLPRGTPVAMVELRLSGLRGMRTGKHVPASALPGRRVVAVTGIGNPSSFCRQLAAYGAHVTPWSFPDHHAYRMADVNNLLTGPGKRDLVIVTEKDAVKLERLWPVNEPEPLVAELAVQWDHGREAVESALLHLIQPIRGGENRCHP